MKNFNGRPFFWLFFIARANQKIPNLAATTKISRLLYEIFCSKSSRPDSQNLRNAFNRKMPYKSHEILVVASLKYSMAPDNYWFTASHTRVCLLLLIVY
jgi:hypothetical protein